MLPAGAHKRRAQHPSGRPSVDARDQDFGPWLRSVATRIRHSRASHEMRGVYAERSNAPCDVVLKTTVWRCADSPANLSVGGARGDEGREELERVFLTFHAVEHSMLSARSANRTQSMPLSQSGDVPSVSSRLCAPPRSRALLRGLIRPGCVPTLRCQESAARVSNPAARLIRPSSSPEIGGQYGASGSNRAAMPCKSMPSTSREAPRSLGTWIRTTMTSAKGSRPTVRRSQAGPGGGSRALALRLMRARSSLDVAGG